MRRMEMLMVSILWYLQLLCIHGVCSPGLKGLCEYALATNFVQELVSFRLSAHKPARCLNRRSSVFMRRLLPASRERQQSWRTTLFLQSIKMTDFRILPRMETTHCTILLRVKEHEIFLVSTCDILYSIVSRIT